MPYMGDTDGDPFIRAHWKAMLLGLAALILILNACYARPDSFDNSTGIGYYHDDAHGVSCWTFGNGAGSSTAAISCLPDSQVRQR